MTDPKAIAERYIALWNERDATARRAKLAAEWTGNASYIDPLATVSGAAEIDTMIAAVQSRFPDFAFRLLGTADGYGDKVRFSWGLGPHGATDAPIEGTDFAIVTDGRIASVTGFLDKVPAA